MNETNQNPAHDSHFTAVVKIPRASKKKEKNEKKLLEIKQQITLIFLKASAADFRQQRQRF